MSMVRWSEITESLRNLIANGELRPGDRLPSEKVLAAQWGVCRMTAHRAMSELEREGLVIRKRRLGTIVTDPNEKNTEEETIGKPATTEAPLFPVRLGNPKRVALLCFHVNDFPQVDYIQGFRSGLPDEYQLLLCDTENRAHTEAELLTRLSGEADAICLYPTCAPANSSLLTRIANEGTAVICLDRVPDGMEAIVDGVVTDNYGATHAALSILATRGHQHIALLTTEFPGVSSLIERRSAWRATLSEWGLADFQIDSLLRRFPPGLGYDFDMLCQVVHDALYTLCHSLPEPPTAVLCTDDFFLSAAVEACDRMGLLLPEDFEILSFSDYPPLATRIANTSHRINQCAREMGRLAAERLHQRLSGTLAGPTETVRVPAVLRPAGSSDPITLQSKQENFNAPPK